MSTVASRRSGGVGRFAPRPNPSGTCAAAVTDRRSRRGHVERNGRDDGSARSATVATGTPGPAHLRCRVPTPPTRHPPSRGQGDRRRDRPLTRGRSPADSAPPAVGGGFPHRARGGGGLDRRRGPSCRTDARGVVVALLRGSVQLTEPVVRTHAVGPGGDRAPQASGRVAHGQVKRRQRSRREVATEPTMSTRLGTRPSGPDGDRPVGVPLDQSAPPRISALAPHDPHLSPPLRPHLGVRQSPARGPRESSSSGETARDPSCGGVRFAGQVGGRPSGPDGSSMNPPFRRTGTAALAPTAAANVKSRSHPRARASLPDAHPDSTSPIVASAADHASAAACASGERLPHSAEITAPLRSPSNPPAPAAGTRPASARRMRPR